MNRDWHKDMERIQLGRKLFETYGAVIEGVNSKESLDEVLGYWLQQYAELQSRNDEMLKVLERIKADIDEFRSYIDIEACESVEDQARAFNEVLKAERERADELQKEYRYVLMVKEDFVKGYHLQEERANSAEARERKLRETIEEVLREATKWENPYEGYGDLQRMLLSLYPKE
ncbi:hypothetical protein [Paenibacillus sp. PDC88]|uniref:hypothetical protein n=1 Tax=Paenibacillus sp. PDC88 TaxID=1884375 RepID=UPI00089ABAE3|nr:hypothetical protein [Paenibacillus sp. PDC88]SDX05034.1 hypothetical protein SAMN05518848_104196 [Paenibacillus sp. PDC88]